MKKVKMMVLKISSGICYFTGLCLVAIGVNILSNFGGAIRLPVPWFLSWCLLAAGCLMTYDLYKDELKIVLKVRH